MFSYYLWERAYHDIGILPLQANLIRLNEVLQNHDKHDAFYFSFELWNVKIDNTNNLATCVYNHLPDKQFMRNVLPRMLNAMKSCAPIATKKELDDTFSSTNAFWGEQFQPKESYCLATLDDYLTFRSKNLVQGINAANFWELKDILFKKIQFCDAVKSQIARLGSSDYFNQIIDRLLELDRFNMTWTKGSCTADQINKKTSLRVSYESDTLNHNEKLKRLRMFQLPNCKSTAYFEMHIKTGDLRIHLFPQNSNYTIYVGYIGSHLPI